ncbi:uncharacterized protein Z519_07869 [Cladophialophora bantiana CBS 173.52]|uniref:Uncharacterized protein n=1 Tax=Cladophialophora bantiana (strain ATCC 10958 / CBS 173.52 / CDC B-1940 / NIH 8579) TaxID=1442370 RepID=A0A0D2I4V4_CLAB1|nr:uncharacterized protein Z519_07869 [Cladophialophora bantiana CBS 173.52]KIW91899.1 hypothetical protein Z519_07869 [Cladophialophora bantiana CBS 173.52]
MKRLSGKRSLPTGYFDISPTLYGSSQSVSPADISPGTQLRRHSQSTTRRPYFRFHPEYDAIHKRIHSHTTKTGRPGEILGASETHTLPREETLSGKPRTGRSAEFSSLHSSRRSSGASAKSSPPLGVRPTKESHSYPFRRPKVSRALARSPSWTTRVEGRNASADFARRPSSTVSETKTQTSVGDIIVVRTDQTPLRPPSKSIPPAEKSKTGSIKVETEFTEPDSRRRKTQSSEQQGQTSSRRSSLNPKQILTIPLHYIRRASLPKRARTPTITEPQPSSNARDTRMADHTSQLKRNYTSETLQRVTGILQEIKQGPQTSLWPPQVIRPLRWRTFSDKSFSQGKKEPQTVQGITSEIGNNQKCSGEQFSDIESYTSSQRNLRLGVAPSNTPDETATYKVKRSPSAETEEFLRVDISVRGGTSYLPSEARRIHTPPLPEEGADGRWKGFFFDYNAPRRPGSLRGSDSAEAGVDSASTSPESTATLGHPLSAPISKKLERTQSKNKRILAGDWYDVKLAELDLGIQADQGEMNNAKEGDRRVNSPECLSKIQKILQEAEQFDLTIPEHLPSSPLCPRHPRYWRVVKGRGSQFRGCWMHGVGVFE